MKEKIMYYFRFRTVELMPFALSVVLSLAVFSIYSVKILSIWTLAVILINAAMFVLCRFTDKHNVIGGIIITVLTFNLLRLFLMLIFGRDWGMSFQQWFLTGADKVETQFEYLLAFCVSFVPFFAVTVYYFSCVLYRMSFLTLVSIIPCALSVKVLAEIDNVFITLIAMLNIAVLMINLREKGGNGRVVFGRTASVFSASVFGFVLLIFSALMPKENEARHYDEFERLFMQSNNNSSMLDYSMLSEFSGGPDSFRNFSNQYLYMLYGDTLTYFKRQTFDMYDFENYRWYGEEYYSKPAYTNEEWLEKQSALSLEKLRMGMLAADKYSDGFIEKYGLERLAQYDNYRDEIKMINVIPENFGAVYYIAPARTVKVTATGENEIFVTRGGVFRNEEKPHDPRIGYQVWFYDEFESRYMWMDLGGADFSDEGSAQMLSELCDILRENNDPLLQNAEAFLTVHNEAMEYNNDYNANCENISSEIKELALEITSGLEYDWQKAEALQSYFTLNGYIYDLDYIPPDPSLEYFLFESKRGSCTHYASAYVLMARSLGLTARYTEGYSPDITGRDGVYAVRDSCSHAYPEVYIQNMGWIVFEPTVPSNYNRMADVNEDENGFELSIDYKLVFVICVISAIILTAALCAVFIIPICSERLFVKRLGDMSPEESIRAVYLRISRKTVSGTVKNAEALTPYELFNEIERVTGCDTGDFPYTAEKALFDSTADQSGKKQAYEIYEAVRCGIKEYRNEQKKLRQKKMKGG